MEESKHHVTRLMRETIKGGHQRGHQCHQGLKDESKLHVTRLGGRVAGSQGQFESI